MEILFACHRFPYPPNRGGKIRPFNMIRHLSARHRVTVATVAHSEQEVEAGADLKKYCAELIYDVVPSPVRWLRAAAVLPLAPSSSAWYFRSPKVIDTVRATAQTRKFDCVFVHCAFAAQFVEQVPAPRRIMDFGDLDSGKWLEYASERSFPLSAAYAWEARKLRRYELRLASEFDVCTFTAPGELEQFRALSPNTPAQLIPNGVDAAYFRMRTPRRERPPIIAFLGRMDYFPNVKGATWFATEVFPSVQKQRPDAVFRIVGSNPIASIQALQSNPGVQVTGSVADVRPLLDDAAISVVPLTLARGTQNKMLECMAMGVPVACTPQAAKGIDAVPGRDFLVASSPQEFSAAILQVINSPDVEQQLATSGRAQVEAAHDWARSMGILDEIVERPAHAKRDLVSQLTR